MGKKLKFTTVPKIFAEDTNQNSKIVKPSQKTSKSFRGKSVIIGTPFGNNLLKQIPTILKEKEVSNSQIESIYDIPLFNPHDYVMAPKKNPEKNSESESLPEQDEEEPSGEKLSEKNIEQERKEALRLAERLKRCEKVLAKTEKSRINLQNHLKTLKVRFKRLEEITDESKVLSRLKTVFNDDQMKALCRYGIGRVIWSDATMEKALKLRLTCGETGYNELLRQNIPLPSLRSLRRALQVSRFTKRFSNEVIEFLRSEFKNVEGGESEGLEEMNEEIKNENENEEFNEMMET